MQIQSAVFILARRGSVLGVLAPHLCRINALRTKAYRVPVTVRHQTVITNNQHKLCQQEFQQHVQVRESSCVSQIMPGSILSCRLLPPCRASDLVTEEHQHAYQNAISFIKDVSMMFSDHCRIECLKGHPHGMQAIPYCKAKYIEPDQIAG